MEDNLYTSSYSYKKFFILFSILLVVVLGGASYYFFYFYSPKVEEVPIVQITNIYKFSGSPIRVEGRLITLRGIYLSSKTIPDSLASVRDFTFLVDSRTVFNKRDIQWPDWDKLTAGGKTSGTFKFKDLPRTDSSGSLTDFGDSLKDNLGNIFVEVDFSSPIQNIDRPSASSVYYEIMNVPLASQNL